MPANDTDGDEREACDGCDKNIAARDGTVLGANIYCQKCIAEMGASYMPDDREALDQALCEGATKSTAADHLGPRERAHILDAIQAAGFTRDHHGERVAILTRRLADSQASEEAIRRYNVALISERDAARASLVEMSASRAFFSASADALAAKLAEVEREHTADLHRITGLARESWLHEEERDDARKERDAAIARAEAAERERDANAQSGIEAVGRLTDQRDAANKRSAALAEALRQVRYFMQSAEHLAQIDIHAAARVIDAALAGNGTGEG